MIETRARVVSISNGKAWVEASSQQGCAACQSQSSCGVSGLGKYFGRNKPPVAVACELAVQPGDSLVLSLAESDLLRAGILAYLLPTVLSVLGAITTSLFGLGDAAAVAAMLAGFAAGLAIARVFAHAPHIQISRTPLSTAPNSAVPDSFQPLQGDPHD
jgi:sigma-E factor negative regulatory protein RseC